eukprot:TRINITY_DN4366_c0_g1_i1.p1 TRINITY_DN4366_c0_g1~~TRINITY_DN4366_c0_g1_i1.p1  ORF type:complete len:328 (-),score=18.67 TRINITY_DN4366_c0_g1_i1:55-1038(-)
MRKSVSLGAPLGHTRRRSSEASPTPQRSPSSRLALVNEVQEEVDSPTWCVSVNDIDLSDPTPLKRRVPQLSTSRSMPASKSPIGSARSPSSVRSQRQLPPDTFALPSLVSQQKDKSPKAAKPKEDEGKVQRMIRGQAHKYRGKYEAKEVLLLKDIFNDMDRDGSGEVSYEEFQEVMERRQRDPIEEIVNPGASRPMPSQFILAFFNVVDSKRRGVITFKQLLRMKYPLANARDMKEMMDLCYPPVVQKKKAEHVLTAQEYQQLEDLFYMYDSDRSGHITFEELRAATLHLPGVTRADARELMKEMDQDNDGLVSKEEFITHMKGMFS